MVAASAAFSLTPCANLLLPHSDRLCFPKPASSLPPNAFHRKPTLPLLHTNRAPLSPAKVAVESDQIGSPQQKERKSYHFVVANAKFMLDEEEHFREQLFERLLMFKERNREQDFWLVIEPKFLDKFPNITKRLKRPAVALVSTDATWITFMKLRLDRVLTESFEADTVEEALASNPADLNFDKPENWIAPYPKYESGWWENFLLKA